MVLFSMQYSMVFQDVRLEIYQHLVANDSSSQNAFFWVAPTFENYQSSWVLPIYLRIYSYFFWVPAIKLYMQGPAFSNLGFWNGKSKIDICAAVTNIDAQFWISKDNMQKCDETIFKKLESFLTITHCIFVAFLFITVCYWMLTNWFYNNLVNQITENLVQRVLNHRIFADLFSRRRSNQLLQSQHEKSPSCKKCNLNKGETT
jgi:hypothetical protein